MSSGGRPITAFPEFIRTGLCSNLGLFFNDSFTNLISLMSNLIAGDKCKINNDRYHNR